ncbi:nitroreductase [Permianibacter sp. IMCC34836]|uniref:nitroreductase family protein n=1 Tax=Permianibacter fluminis TaxID=2738515 RepID=UPI00155484C1|nr:nitroreductase [Permianibacter fluminis]NQD37546.1 nitroreductase [Permianibacter fluminis]
MTPLDFLLTRRSFPILTAPAPSNDQINTLMQAALRAPDHGNLKPFRFLVCEGEKLTQLGELYARGMQQSGETDSVKLERAKGLPLRAPMVLIAVARIQNNPKIPAQEQLLTAGLATFQLINAAQAMGFGSYWRTGDIAYNPAIWQLLGLTDGEQVIGYVYVGTIKGEPKDTGAAPTPDSIWRYV